VDSRREMKVVESNVGKPQYNYLQEDKDNQRDWLVKKNGYKLC